MNSEKVKEIKDSIQRKINRSEKGEDDFVNCVSVDMLKMYLTLINELENENERLMKLQAKGGYRVAELGIENQQLKDKIAELEEEIERLETAVDIANERSYRKKFIEEWRKEYQKELDKEGKGHIAGFPDFDLVYKLYFEQKDRIAELENTDYYKEIEKKKEELLCKEYGLIKYEKETAGKYLKQFAEKLKETAFRMSTNSNEKFIYAQNVDVILDKLLKEYEKWKISD